MIFSTAEGERAQKLIASNIASKMDRRLIFPLTPSPSLVPSAGMIRRDPDGCQAREKMAIALLTFCPPLV